MNKLRATKKQILSAYKNAIQCGTVEVYYLNKGNEPRYYTAGVYGWNADIYEANTDTVLVSGDRAFGNIKADYDLIREYEEIARGIFDDYYYKNLFCYDEMIIKIEKKRNELVTRILKGDN